MIPETMELESKMIFFLVSILGCDDLDLIKKAIFEIFIEYGLKAEDILVVANEIEERNSKRKASLRHGVA